MSNTQNTKNEQQSTSEQLTEQFNHGLLPDGWYYYKASDGRSNIATEYGLFCIEADNKVKVEVLAKVPTFDEWQELKEFADYSIHNRDELTRQINFWMQENTKLKEELKEICEKYIKIKTKVSAYEDAYKDSQAYIKKLKELLKECKDVMQQRMLSVEEYKLFQKIDEVLK